MNNITVLIISNGRLEYLRQNINSLMKYNADIFVVVNGKNDQTINFLTATEKNYSYLKFSHMPHKYLLQSYLLVYS